MTNESNPAQNTAPDSGEKEWWLDDPANVKKLLKIFFISCGVLVFLDLFKYIFEVKHKVPGDLEMIPGFFGIYGFAGCVALVFIAKLMRKVLMRPEDYYDR